MLTAQTILRNPTDGFLDDIIRLQLKKPKSWNWELSTSKSSPHIMLPTIKLYNSKGKLLVEARDNGMQRRSWHSSDIKPPTTVNTNINNISGFKDSIPRHLRKCSSDILEHNRKNNIPSKFESINLSKRTATRERASKERENLLRTSKSQPENSFVAITKNRTDVLNENRKSGNSCDNVINPKDRKSLNHLRKSRSDVLEGYKRPENEQALLRKNRSARDLPRSMQIRPPSYHKRTRSDDLFQRMMKYNEESIKRAIADGYRNFITPLVSEKSEETANDNVKLENNRKKNRQNHTLLEGETVLQSNNFDSPEISYLTHKRYKTRTCSAGTLIITEESFNGSNHRRRRNKMSDGASTSDTKTGASASFKKDNALESSRNTIDKSRVEHIRQASDPASSRKKGGLAQKLSDRYPLSVDPTPNKQEDVKERTSKCVNKPLTGRKLFRSDSYPFECEEIIENGIENSFNDNNNNNKKCDDCYTVQEPITPGSDVKERKLSGPLIECLERLERIQRKKRRKYDKQPNHDSGSSGTTEKNTEYNETGNNLKGTVNCG